MQNLNHIEEIHVNLDMVKGLGLMEDDDVRDALVASAGADFTIALGEGIFGNNVDVEEIEGGQLTIKNARGLGYYGSR